MNTEPNDAAADPIDVDTRTFLQQLLADPERHAFVARTGSLSMRCRACAQPLEKHPLQPDSKPREEIIAFLDMIEAETLPHFDSTDCSPARASEETSAPRRSLADDAC